MPTELEMQRRQTKAYIAANPVSINLIPRLRVTTGTGTKLVDQTPRGVQVVRLIDQSATGGPTPGTVASADGKQRKVEFQMLGTFAATFEVLDYWMDGSTKYEVAELLPYNGYERRAQVVRYGA